MSTNVYGATGVVGTTLRRLPGPRIARCVWPRHNGSASSDPAPMTAPRIVLYTKPGCHLCDDMRDQLSAALRGAPEPVQHVDIAADLDVYMRYRHDIPVLLIDGREVARHRITDEALRGALLAAGLV